MKLHTFITLFAIGAATAVAAGQDQEIRVVTADRVVGPLPPGMAGNQPMKTGAGVIFGQVTEGDSNRTVPGAIVTINMPNVQPLRVMADAQGRFGFRDLPAGSFNITVLRPGWVAGAYGRTRPGGPGLPLVLADGERVSGVVLPIWRFGSITGTVVDESGDPLVNTPVRVLRRSTIGGRTRLTMGPQDTTDDRGTYRISMLEPGEYVVAVPMQQASMDMSFTAADATIRAEVVAVRAMAAADTGGGAFFFNAAGGGAPAGIGEDGRPLSFPTVFYPNASTSARATLVAVSSGEERGSVDFQLRGVPTSRVSGTATGPDGPVARLQFTLVPAEAAELASPLETLTGATDSQGRFTIQGVPPGQYVLRAVQTPRMSPGEVTTITQADRVMVMRVESSAAGPAPLPTEPTLWAEMSLAVGARDVADVSVSLRPGIRVAGMLQFNGAAERPAPDRYNSIGIILEPADPRPGVPNARGRAESNGQFRTMGVPPGRYFIRVAGSFPGWSFHSAQAGGRDASVTPIELDSSDLSGVTLTFTDRPSELSGQVTADGQMETATVLVFPAEQSAWVGYGTSSRRFSNARVDAQGKFKVTNLPAGDYLAVAIPDKMANDWQNPKFLESLVVEATRVRIRDGEQATASLKVAR
jgi:hypothetical protein